MIRLWIHESRRVFCDRLVDNDDRKKFQGIIETMLYKHFKEDNFKNLVRDEEVLLYGDFMNHENSAQRNYSEITDLWQLRRVIAIFVEDYNVVLSHSLKLVLFEYALEHLTRITRIIRQPFGHAMLIGNYYLYIVLLLRYGFQVYQEVVAKV